MILITAATLDAPLDTADTQEITITITRNAGASTEKICALTFEPRLDSAAGMVRFYPTVMTLNQSQLDMLNATLTPGNPGPDLVFAIRAGDVNTSGAITYANASTGNGWSFAGCQVQASICTTQPATSLGTTPLVKIG